MDHIGIEFQNPYEQISQFFPSRIKSASDYFLKLSLFLSEVRLIFIQKIFV